MATVILGTILGGTPVTNKLRVTHNTYSIYVFNYAGIKIATLNS